jgi:hypothetical protein
LTDLPLIPLIRSHVIPDTILPPQLARQAEPATVATTVTLVPALIEVRAGEAVVVWGRRFAEHTALFMTVAPKTWPGVTTAVIAKRKRADSAALNSSDGSDGRAERRTTA